MVHSLEPIHTNYEEFLKYGMIRIELDRLDHGNLICLNLIEITVFSSHKIMTQ